jgi:hypothetical protein
MNAPVQSMINISDFMMLLGKSERDEKVIQALSTLGTATPLKRPKRGDDSVHVIDKDRKLELEFATIESLPERAGDFAEGELIFASLFVDAPKNDKEKVVLPFLLDFKMSRSMAYQVFGKPYWTSPSFDVKMDVWQIEGYRVHIEFTKDENEIVAFNFSRNQEF